MKRVVVSFLLLDKIFRDFCELSSYVLVQVIFTWETTLRNFYIR